VSGAGERLRSVEEAREAILAAIPGPLDSEASPVDRALGRVLAADVAAAVTLPPWDNSAMDGYAIRAADVAGASDDRPVRLEVVGEVPAGGVADRAVEAGTAIRIATGAPIPPGADAVVPVEETTPLNAAGSAGARGRDALGPLPEAVLVHAAGRAGAHIRRRGSDLSEGATILAPGAAITPAAVALAAGAGIASLQVHRRPRVAVLTSGDELRGPDRFDDVRARRGVPDSNGPMLLAAVADAGADPTLLGPVRDDAALVRDRLERARLGRGRAGDGGGRGARRHRPVRADAGGARDAP
jgi:molybdopterin molybdotransferase